MSVPKSETESNAKKALTDRLVSEFLDIDKRLLKNISDEAAYLIRSNPKVVVCGAAGSSKTSFAKYLSKRLEVPAFDLDEYIPDGWTGDEKKYRINFLNGLDNLWTEVPTKGGWIIEHVHACSPEVAKMFAPKWAIHLNPGKEQLKAVARMRDAVAGEPDGTRSERAISSGRKAFQEFSKIPGKVLAEGSGWILKELT